MKCIKNPDTCHSIPPGDCCPDCHGFESKQIKENKNMKSITVKETKTIKILQDRSWLMNEDFKQDIYSLNLKGECKVIEKLLRIPNKQKLDMDFTHDIDIKYLNTKIEIDNNIYYTHSSFIKEREVTTDTKELFIPDFNGIKKPICFYINMVTDLMGCNGIGCGSCILDPRNFKHLK